MYAIHAILGIALLMVVHEAGHFFVARAFGMRVERFAIGIGPTIWRHQPKDSDTIYQVGLIPFLAYVQIAGLNPFEEIDDDDEGSYANATLFARICAIVAGPLANYLFASLLFFAALLAGGKPSETTEINVEPDRPAAAAGLVSGDKIVSIDGEAIKKWKDIPPAVQPKPGQEIKIEVQRGGRTLTLSATPEDRDGKGLLGVSAIRIPMPWSEAGIRSFELPAMIVAMNLEGIGRMFSGKEKPKLSGPLGLMRETKKAAKAGFSAYLWMVAFLSTAVGFFNMLPVPALDGGRLMFLGYEAVTRRRPNQKVEAQIHMVGMIMLLTTLVLVTYREWGTDKTPSEQAAENQKKAREAEKAKADKASGKPAENKPTKSKPSKD
jgi:regulator of sigma E protease